MSHNRLVKLLLVWIAFGHVLSAAEMPVTIRLANSEIVPQSTLGAAVETATQVLKSAGVAPVWIECEGTEPSPCRGPLGSQEFWLYLLSGRPSKALKRSAGYAVLYASPSGRTGYAGVFYPRVVEIARDEDCPAATILGATFAHEIGHLLLGSNAHSSEGVMRARLRRAEFILAMRNELRFTAGQANRIRRAHGCTLGRAGAGWPASLTARPLPSVRDPA